MKSVTKITPEQLERALALQRQGWTHERIAVELGTHRNTIGRAISIYNRKVAERLIRRSLAERGRQLQLLDAAIEAAFGQWVRSTEDVVTVKTTTNELTGLDTETITTRKGQSGNPALLAELRNALAERRKILGLDKQDADTGDDPLIVAEMMARKYQPEDDE